MVSIGSTHSPKRSNALSRETVVFYLRDQYTYLMNTRGAISPQTLSVDLDPDGIFIEYLDGRRVFYHGVPQKAEERVRCAPGKQAHVLVTDESGTEGILIYLNDTKTHSDILESTGVGRVNLTDEKTEVLPGVTAHRDDHAIEIEADPTVLNGRVFVFEEDDFEEHSYEIITP